MKSDIVPEREYIECGCGSPDHLLVFEFDSPCDLQFRNFKYREISVQFTSPYYDSFWRRVKSAFGYIFKKNKYLSTSDCLLFNKKNIETFRIVLSRLEEFAKEEEENEKKWVEKIIKQQQ